MTGEIRVLHVDDDPAFLGVVEEFFDSREAPFEVVTTTDAAEALERLDRDRPNCVVSDYEMPGMDGLEFLEAVRQRYPDLPFVLFTGKGSEEIASEAISAGATEYLQKGGGTDQYDLLANRVQNAVEGYRAERALRRERSRMEFALESTDAAVWTRDIDTDRMELHPENCPVFDASIGSFQEFLRQVHPDDREDVEASVREAAAAVEPYSVEFRYFNEGLRWAEMYGRTVGEGGEPSLQTGITRDVTDRREHRRRFETLTETLPGIVYRCRVAHEWPMEDVRGDVEGFVGYTAEQLESGDVVWGEDILHPEDRKRAMDVVEEALAQGEPFELIYRVLTDDGETRWALERGCGVETPDGEVDVLEGFITDITDRKRRERELHRSERRFESIFEDPNILLGLLEPDGTLSDVNETALEYVDADRSAVIGEPFPETPWWAEGDTSDIRRWIDRAADGEYVPYENSHPGPDGEVFVEGMLRPVTDSEDEVTSIIASTRDVTERVRRERELRRSERRFESMFNDPNILVGLLKPDGTLIDVNETALGYVKADRSELIGEPFPDTPWWTVDTESSLRRWIDRAADGEYVPYEVTHPDTEGGEIFVEGTFRPVTDNKGEVTSIIVSASDVTERVQRERRLERQNKRFDELASIVSHDLATPITTVQGRLELAAETGDVEHVEAARSALKRVDDLREGIVDTLRSRTIVEEINPVDVGELARAAWTGVADEGAELRIADPPEIEGDADAVRRLLQNLLSNAVEHGPTDSQKSTDDAVENGGTEVTVRVGGTIEGFYVADDGSGIPEAEREDVFTPGFSTKESGTGMGMASVSQIVDAHGWNIDVEESDAGGARFVIRT